MKYKDDLERILELLLTASLLPAESTLNALKNTLLKYSRDANT